MRTAGEQAGQSIDQSGANMLQATMNAQQANAATKMAASQSMPGVAAGMYGAPSSLELAFLSDIRKPYDLANMGNQNQMYSTLLGNLAPFIYQPGAYVGSPNAASQIASLFGSGMGMLGNIFGGNILQMLMNQGGEAAQGGQGGQA
jgi:hypothetical protein